MTAAHQRPVGLSLNQSQQEISVRFGEFVTQINAQPVTNHDQIPKINRIGSHPDELVSEDWTYLKISGEKHFMHRPIVPGQIADKTLHNFRLVLNPLISTATGRFWPTADIFSKGYAEREISLTGSSRSNREQSYKVFAVQRNSLKEP